MTLGRDLPPATSVTPLAMDSTILLHIAMTGPNPIEWLMSRRRNHYPATVDECVAELVDDYARRLRACEQRRSATP